jgi:diguanylate cyclase (GGDEF)-like protein
MTDHAETRRRVPFQALLISLAALAVPVGAALYAPEWHAYRGVLLWLNALLPAFLFAYYRGLQGVAAAVAVGMAVLSLTQAAIVWLGLPEPDWPLLLAVVVVYVSICGALAIFAEVLHRERHAAEAAALVDPLSGLPNRRHAEFILDMQFAAAARGRRLSVVLFDLDDFKGVNDRFGHAAGDRALRAFSGMLKRHTRRMDVSARFGGEEFLTVLTDADLEEALHFAERVRDETGRIGEHGLRLSVSAGVATFAGGMDTWEQLVGAADEALYEAKKQGRNRVQPATVALA